MPAFGKIFTYRGLQYPDIMPGKNIQLWRKRNSRPFFGPVLYSVHFDFFQMEIREVIGFRIYL